MKRLYDYGFAYMTFLIMLVIFISINLVNVTLLVLSRVNPEKKYAGRNYRPPYYEFSLN